MPAQAFESIARAEAALEVAAIVARLSRRDILALRAALVQPGGTDELARLLRGFYRVPSAERRLALDELIRLAGPVRLAD